MVHRSRLLARHNAEGADNHFRQEILRPPPILMPHLRHALALAAVILSVTEARAIIGGSEADPGEFPWIAGILRKDVVPGPGLAGPGLVGGGVLVGDQWVATAAHSVTGLSAATLEVWLGTADLNDASSRRVVGVLAVFIHPDFAATGGTSVNDLALLLLDRRIGGIAPLPLLEDPGELTEGDPVNVAGWGTSTVGETVATVRLQKAPAEIVPAEEATAVFGPVIEPVHLPARDPAEIARPCFGDSGGPLVKQVGGVDRLAGVVSFGTADCGDGSAPTIYTRMPLFASWVKGRLDFTASAPGPRLSGRGRPVARNAAPRLANGTLFGLLRRRSAAQHRNFRLANQGPGWLTVRGTTVSGRGFRLAKTPAKILQPGQATSFAIRFRAPRPKRRYPGRIVLQTNETAQPGFVVRLAAVRR